MREAYDAIDWPIFILLGAMIPLGDAMDNTGAAQLIADGILKFGRDLPPVVGLATVLVVTMLLTPLINNAAAVVLMAPIGIGIAAGLGVSVDPLFMAIAVGGSSAFLTPIGHQSNTL